MPKKIQTTAERSGILPVSEVVKIIREKIDQAVDPPAPVKRERAKKVLSPEETEKRRAILSERLVKARAAKAAKKSQV